MDLSKSLAKVLFGGEDYDTGSFDQVPMRIRTMHFVELRGIACNAMIADGKRNRNACKIQREATSHAGSIII